MEAGTRWIRVLVVHDPWTKFMEFSIRKSIIPGILQRGPSVSLKSSCSPQCSKKTLVFENNSGYSPSHFQKLQIGSYNFFLPYLCNSNSKSSDSCAKILRITSSFILCIHLIYVHCIYRLIVLLHVRKCCARAVLRGFSRPSHRGVSIFLCGAARQVLLIIL
jgi:hypothetical protein